MLASAGVVVVTYEQIGFGGRVREGGTSFYARNGNRGSLLGHMVGDVSAVVDFLLCHAGGNRDPMCNTVEGWGDVNIPRINPTHIFAAGYSLGGAVSLHAAALDKRIAGVASFAGFTPMRTDANDSSTGGLRRLYELFALAPRLVQFDADPSGVPYDYDDLLEAIAPRPTLLYTPTNDRWANFVDVNNTISKARSAWSDGTLLSVQQPNDTSKMEAAQAEALIAWLNTTIARG